MKKGGRADDASPSGKHKSSDAGLSSPLLGQSSPTARRLDNLPFHLIEICRTPGVPLSHKQSLLRAVLRLRRTTRHVRLNRRDILKEKFWGGLVL